MNLADALTDGALQRIATTICALTQSTIYPLYNDVLAQATEAQISAAPAPLDELVAHAIANEHRFVRHAVALIRVTRGAPMEQAYGAHDRDLPAAWAPGEVLGLSRDFVIPHAIIFWLLDRAPAQLEGYLKATRTPRARQEAKRLRDGFAKL